MTLTHESLRPLVGKKVTVTRNDIPGSWTGVLEGYWDDGFLRMVKRDGVREVIHYTRIETLHSKCGYEIQPPNTDRSDPPPVGDRKASGGQVTDASIECLMRVYRETYGTGALSKETTQTIESLITPHLMRTDRGS